MCGGVSGASAAFAVLRALAAENPNTQVGLFAVILCTLNEGLFLVCSARKS
jgi:hypothetical protein